MGLQDVLGLRYEGLTNADPELLTEIGKVLHNENSRAVAASFIARKTSCLCFGFWVSSVAAQFIQVFDSSSLPADTAVPLLSFPVAATSGVGAVWMPYPRSFQQGLVLCNSSTQHTKTIGSADCLFDVQVI